MYILTSRSRAIYVGMSSDIEATIVSHRSGRGHTSRYSAYRLVYVERDDRVTDAILREKQVKKWRREQKVALIEKGNPNWRDLARDYFPDIPPPRGGRPGISALNDWVLRGGRTRRCGETSFRCRAILNL